jgi:hypothetical protein
MLLFCGKRNLYLFHIFHILLNDVYPVLSNGVDLLLLSRRGLSGGGCTIFLVSVGQLSHARRWNRVPAFKVV